MNVHGKGRIADWCELQGNSARLGDIKSASTVVGSAAVTRRLGPETVFRPSSVIAQQHAAERHILRQARDANARVVLEGRDPLTGSKVSFEVEWSRIQPTRVTSYMSLPSN